MAKKYSLLLLLVFASYLLNAQKIVLLQQGKQTTIRGLSVVNDNIAWTSGSNGYTGLTLDGGKTWTWQRIKGFEKADFRDIEAFSDKEALIMASGTPALILKTTDGGKNWQVKYCNTDTTYFLDAMKFIDIVHGFVLGDPINKKFLLLETNDRGESWHFFVNAPDAMHNEAAFAASGTCLRLTTEHIRIVSGGSVAMLHDFAFNKNEWTNWALPIARGKASKGVFSFADGKNQSVFVGGDYAHDKVKDSVNAIEKKVGASLRLLPVKNFPTGYQSCVEYLTGDTYLSTGTSGTNLTTDGGETWTKIDDSSFNVCRKAKQGKLVLLAGNNGTIAILKL